IADVLTQRMKRSVKHQWNMVTAQWKISGVNTDVKQPPVVGERVLLLLQSKGKNQFTLRSHLQFPAVQDVNTWQCVKQKQGDEKDRKRNRYDQGESVYDPAPHIIETNWIEGDQTPAAGATNTDRCHREPPQLLPGLPGIKP